MAFAALARMNIDNSKSTTSPAPIPSQIAPAPAPTDETELCFRFLAFAESIRADLTNIAAEANLLFSDLLALRAMSQNGSPVHSFELAGLLGCSRSYVTEIAQRLLAAGLIAEHRDPMTPRWKRLALTRSGHDVYGQMMAEIDEEDPFIMLTPWDRDDLAILVERLTSDPFAHESEPLPDPASLEEGSPAPYHPVRRR